MTSSAQYRIELVSAGSESGESAMVRGTSSSFGKVRRQKYYRPRQRIPDACRSWKRLGLSICILGVVLVFLWMLVLSMMTVELFKRTLDLQRMTKRISTETELLPEEIQSYQSMSKYMQKNQSTINTQLMAVTRKLANVSSQFSKVEKIIHSIEEKFKLFPDLINVPSQVVALSSSVAGLGNEVEDMKTSLSRVRDEEDSRRQSLESLRSNIQTLTNDIIELNQTFTKQNGALAHNPVVSESLSSVSERILETIDPKLSDLNESLSRRLRYASEDQEKDHKMLTDLQEALVNITSQVMSLRQKTDENKADFNSLELKILEIRMQMKAMPVQKGTSEPLTTILSTTTSSPSDLITLFLDEDVPTGKSDIQTLEVLSSYAASPGGSNTTSTSSKETIGSTTEKEKMHNV